MFIFDKKIQILSFRVSSNEISYTNSDKELIFRSKIISKNTSDCGFFLAKQYFFFTDEKDYKTKFIDIDKNIIIDTNSYLSPHYQTFVGNILMSNEYVDLVNYETNLVEFNIHSLEKRIVKENISFGVHERYNSNIIINQGRTILKSLSLLTGDYDWEIDLGGQTAEGEAIKIQKIIGLWEQQLILMMSNDELLSVNVEAGKVWWQIPHFFQKYLPDWRNYSQFRSSYWHIEQGKLFHLDGNVYYSFDMNTQAFELLWKDSDEARGLTIVHKTYTTDYVYFTAAFKHQLVPHLVGVFNRKTLSIDWVHEVEGLTGSLNQAPQVADNELYVLDTGGTLHIFEKEN